MAFFFQDRFENNHRFRRKRNNNIIEKETRTGGLFERNNNGLASGKTFKMISYGVYSDIFYWDQ